MLKTFVRTIAIGFLAAVATSLLAALPASAYDSPVNGPVVDPWRPPATQYSAGNRGIEYRTTPGSTVTASEDGTVSFVGQVGGRNYVVVEHVDGLRTTYGGVSTALVVVGELLEAGASLALAGESLHFGVRNGDVYVDPNTLFSKQAYLVPAADPEFLGLVDVSPSVFRWISEEPQIEPEDPIRSSTRPHPEPVSPLSDAEGWKQGALAAAESVIKGLVDVLVEAG